MSKLEKLQDAGTTPVLLPCPFCGAEPKLYTGSDIVKDSIECLTTGCVTLRAYGETREEAIAAWNRRAQPSSPPPAGQTVTECDDGTCGVCRRCTGNDTLQTAVDHTVRLELRLKRIQQMADLGNDCFDSPEEAVAALVRLCGSARPDTSSVPDDYTRVDIPTGDLPPRGEWSAPVRLSPRMSGDGRTVLFVAVEGSARDTSEAAGQRPSVPCAYCDGLGIMHPSEATADFCVCRAGQWLRETRQDLAVAGTDLTPGQMFDVSLAFECRPTSRSGAAPRAETPGDSGVAGATSVPTALDEPTREESGAKTSAPVHASRPSRVVTKAQVEK